jgi:hypothetical protein
VSPRILLRAVRDGKSGRRGKRHVSTSENNVGRKMRDGKSELRKWLRIEKKIVMTLFPVPKISPHARACARDLQNTDFPSRVFTVPRLRGLPTITQVADWSPGEWRGRAARLSRPTLFARPVFCSSGRNSSARRLRAFSRPQQACALSLTRSSPAPLTTDRPGASVLTCTQVRRSPQRATGAHLTGGSPYRGEGPHVDHGRAGISRTRMRPQLFRAEGAPYTRRPDPRARFPLFFEISVPERQVMTR